MSSDPLSVEGPAPTHQRADCAQVLHDGENVVKRHVQTSDVVVVVDFTGSFDLAKVDLADG